MFGFLVIDTDYNVQQHEVRDVNNQLIGLEPREFLHAKVQSPADMYFRYKSTSFSWFPKELESLLSGPISAGAGQIRAIGRFASMANGEEILNAIQEQKNKITSTSIADSTRYTWKAPNVSGIEVNVVFSLAGGTGAGVFMDMAYLIQRAMSPDPYEINAYAVMPDVFKTMSRGADMVNVEPNAYGAISEIDYFMHMGVEVNGRSKGPKRNEHELKLPGTVSLPIQRSPFDVVFLVGNQNTEGATFSDVKEVSELIATAMYVSSGELQANRSSVMDNLKKVLITGHFDVEQKKAWASGVGFGEIVFDSRVYAERYQRLTELEILRRMLSGGNDWSVGQVDQWINDVKIRENQNRDDVIEAISAPQPAPFMVTDRQSAGESALQHIDNAGRQMLASIESNRKILFEKILARTQEQLNALFRSEGAVGNALNFIRLLQETIKSNFLTEMRAEADDFNTQLANEMGQVQPSAAQLTWFNYSTNKGQFESFINQIISISTEKHKREQAIEFYNDLLRELEDRMREVLQIREVLQEAERHCLSHANDILNGGRDRHRPFSILLHEDLVSNVFVTKEEIGLETWLNKERAFSWYRNKDKDSILDELERHSSTREKTESILEMDIDSVLSAMDAEERKAIFGQLISKSAPLWSHDYGGYLAPNLQRSFVLGVYKENQKIIEELESVLTPEQPLTKVITNDSSRLLLNRHETAIPPFIMRGMRNYEERVKLSPTAHHVDSTWKKKANDLRFRVFPDRGILKEELRELWVSALLFGFIRLKGSKYQMFIDDPQFAPTFNWVTLGQSRAEALEAVFREDGDVDFGEALQRVRVEQLELVKDTDGSYEERRMAFTDRLERLAAIRSEVYPDEFALLPADYEQVQTDPTFAAEKAQLDKELIILAVLRKSALAELKNQ